MIYTSTGGTARSRLSNKRFGSDWPRTVDFMCRNPGPNFQPVKSPLSAANLIAMSLLSSCAAGCGGFPHAVLKAAIEQIKILKNEQATVEAWIMSKNT